MKNIRKTNKMVDFDKALQHVDADGMVDGVTPENWGFKVECFTVARQPRHPYDWSVTLSPGENPYEWGAWIAYCKARRVMAVARMLDSQFRQQLGVDTPMALANKWYFPAKLPSFFDADWSESKDKMAGELFVKWIQRTLDDAEQQIDRLLTAGNENAENVAPQEKETNPWDD